MVSAVGCAARPGAARFFPGAKWLGPLEGMWFIVIANLYGAWRRLHAGARTPAIIHANCGTYLNANLISVHFVNAVWAAIQMKLGLRSAKQFIKFVIELNGFRHTDSDLYPGFRKRLIR
jgi:hypothetical protein